MSVLHRMSGFGFIAAGLFMSPTIADAGDVKVKCWKQVIYDKDGDGYAYAGAPNGDRQERTTTEALRLTCPAGWVRSRGDCDDYRAGVHPRRADVYGNGLDDNCSGSVDEPTFYYSPYGYDNQKTSLSIYVKLNEPIVVSQLDAPDGLSYQIEYQQLTDTGVSLVSPFRSAARHNDRTARLTLSDLSAGTVYRLRVQFYRRAVLGIFPAPRGGFFPRPRIVYYPIGVQSDWYYTMTESDLAVGRARTRMVLLALEQAHRSALGLIGYRGLSEPDGTTFGADLGEKWCSEYYSFVADTHLKGVGHRANTSQVIDYFDGHNLYYSGSAVTYFAWFAQPGDYLAMDTKIDSVPNIHHSALFLAYDAFEEEVWSVEGNTSGYNGSSPKAELRGGNESAIRLRDTGVVLGLGHVGSDMLW